jgi:predicted DNA-binding protein
VTEKRSTSFRLSDDALRLLAEMSERLGISQAACLELAIRKLAKETK